MQTEIIGLIIQTITAVIIGLIPAIAIWIKDRNKIPHIIEQINELKQITIKNDIAILWSQLTSKCKKIIEANYCDVQTMECIDQLFKRYKAIGGNHGVEAMVKQARAICKKTNK